MGYLEEDIKEILSTRESKLRRLIEMKRTINSMAEPLRTGVVKHWNKNHPNDKIEIPQV